MKIENSTISGVGTKTTTSARAADLAKSIKDAATDTGSRSDSVAINPRASQLQALASSLDNLAPTDQRRIDAIKQAITEGRFQVNSSAIADSLINTARELLANN